MKILITGHLGFVGRYFVQKYAQHDITGIDIKGGVDARHFFAVDDSKFDLVIHLAAIVGGRMTIERDPLAVAVDLAIDAGLFNWALKTRPGRVVYFSSSAAYPVCYQSKESYTQLSEDMIDLAAIKNPDLTYGWSKLTGEYLATFLQSAGVPVHVFRPFSGYGPDQALDYPFPSYIERAKRRADPFDIWGDGQQTRDFIHISDVVNACDAAITQDVQGPINLGWGRSTSFNELAALVTTTAGYTPVFNHIAAAPTGVIHRVADATKMRSFYTPQITLEAGVAEALQT